MKINFNKSNDGLVPVIIQDDRTLQVLMLGYMNAEAFEKTSQEKTVTFFSRSKNRLWTKGEESGNFLAVKSIASDCDNDTILIRAVPKNTVCHTGSFSCFGDKDPKGFLYELEATISRRIDEKAENSYTYALFQKGINKMAQKVGEEAVELVIEAKDNQDELFKNEAADLLYHYLILLKAKGMSMQDIEKVLMDRSE
ncbi:bifunctional phosphoribosyl-AMP cyclohydrolase/phosphoribosyl-ATP diphosphatase HisIE [Chryseobacterium camelliae]|uniref:bifunctional phosphoribosyl-AMP cyclohydrolase/phosphoribosyl-ATP diphosphatase HisIE n=1 Tax=Chryseobacterium camelliae TaxID=1265445 RepID=UPI002861F723|nr:bifunctional phosphoribosyl-AMP cyclohydrolase/phosphoribosyl-ATP diphosphatase HisIE [Chryseobacterium camelliae]MDR6515541.1 phosphoribosyl-ATP pyrophosphohydrolase/phosphoribosyl-AMP cyclohydrolase [Chryseobacterium camelliae]